MNQSNQYSGFIRVRVGGVYIENEQLLLIKLRSPISGEDIWIPPGGGVNFKESLNEAIIREFNEETSLKVKVGELLHTSELIEDDYHVIEFFFKVEKVKGEVRLGIDPEHPLEKQLISDIGFFTRNEISKMNVKPEYFKDEFWEA